jgi:hypothetical protein
MGNLLDVRRMMAEQAGRNAAASASRAQAQANTATLGQNIVSAVPPAIPQPVPQLGQRQISNMRIKGRPQGSPLPVSTQKARSLCNGTWRVASLKNRTEAILLFASSCGIKKILISASPLIILHPT